MKLPLSLRIKIAEWCDKVIASRSPDVLIGPDPAHPYMERWFIWPRNRFFNLYLHRILQSDQEDALHDHPAANLSFIVRGAYDEWIGHIDGRHRVQRECGQIIYRNASVAHALILIRPFNDEPMPVLSLWLSGPKYRKWGFWCKQGWVYHRIYNGDTYGGRGADGKGCEP